MMRLYKKLLVMSMLVLLALPATALAYDSFNGVDCSGVASDSAVCNSKTTDNPLSSDNGLIVKISNIIAFVAGIAAVIVIVISGIKYITAGGDPQKAANARGTLINAVVGLIIVVLAETIINVVVA